MILGRDGTENEVLHKARERVGAAILVPTNGRPGPTALVTSAGIEDMEMAQALVNAYTRGTTERDRAGFKAYQIM